MNKGFSVTGYLDRLVVVKELLDHQAIENAIELIRETATSGAKIITCGNGGSAAAASHYITDWNKMVNLATGAKFRGFSLCDNIGLITAFGNDISYDEIFSGQLKSILDPGDLLVAVSGSGNSPNVLRAVEYASQTGARTLAIVGYDGGKLKPLCDCSVHVPSFDMQICEDFHLIFGHMVMKDLCGYPIA